MYLDVFQIVEALKVVNFTTKNGEQVWFDGTGAAVARYEVVNWQRSSGGSVQFKPVGFYDASLPRGLRFLLKTEDIMWPGGKREANICHHSNIYILGSLICGKNEIELFCSSIPRCPCPCVVRAVAQELVKSHRKESRSAATTVSHVLKEKLATAQVQWS